ncbi:MAG: Ppx/GppA family phosphatase [Polyangiaceae bacterium]|nr:Ppx/GppA family phosphatase [Polyangiaceae bacterium]
MTRVAALDIGTNSVLLLVAESTGDRLTPVVERATITRLGEGVDRSGELTASARERTRACLAGYAAEARALGVTALAAVGTSAMRDARGGPEFAAEIAELLGAAPRIVSGDEEARLTFRGALSGLAVAGPTLVFDVGGGSTEIIVGSGRDPGARVSLDVGSVRLTERHVARDPPLDAELDAARATVRAALASAPRPPSGATVVGVAGTVTTLAAIALQLDPYDGARVHGASLPAARVSELTAELGALPLSRRRDVRGLDAKRADVIPCGALIVDEVLSWLGARSLVVSDRGVRWGLAEELAAGGSG